MEEGSYIKMIDMASGNGGQIQVTSVPLVLFKCVDPICWSFDLLLCFDMCKPNIVTISVFCAFSFLCSLIFICILGFPLTRSIL